MPASSPVEAISLNGSLKIETLLGLILSQQQTKSKSNMSPAPEIVRPSTAPAAPWAPIKITNPPRIVGTVRVIRF